ncbi:MAG TPA: BON domain-containing protein [Lysobacter sp.]|nr:BON domain-containing protein [Lysobacter sp.]
MGTLFRIAAAFAAGAAAMYYLDPETGRRRRALVRDRGIAARHDLEDYASAASRRTSDKLQGTAARTRSRVSREPVDDEQLHDRIRSRLGHVVERPGDIEVQVRDGYVVLSGSADEEEIDQLVSAVTAIKGVEGVDNLVSVGGEGSASQQQAH